MALLDEIDGFPKGNASLFAPLTRFIVSGHR